MWPLDRFARSGFASADVVRIGAHAVELWRGGAGSMEQVASEALPSRGSLFDASALVEPLRAIAGRVTSRRAIAVLESAYAPVLLADTGGVLTGAAQVDALLRHRFGLAYGIPGRDAATWRVRWTHRYGDRYAMGYGLDPAVEAALLAGGTSADGIFTAWVPALDWSLSRFGRRRQAARCPWWVWTEQDRSLAVHLSGGQVDALDPALLEADSVTGIEGAIAAAAVRASLHTSAASEVASPTGVGCWRVTERPSGSSVRLREFAVAGDSTSSSSVAARAQPLRDVPA